MAAPPVPVVVVEELPKPPISSPPKSTQSSLAKIESFLNETQYKDLVESSLNFNQRICIERRLRLPFIDTQTGVAQNHSALFMHKRQRIPGLLPGQIYSYPRQRWRKKRRQYLVLNPRAFARAADSFLEHVEGEMHSISQIENPALQDTDSKDSQHMLIKDEVPKEWQFYDEQDMLEMEAYGEPDPDSDVDYEETYNKRSKRKRTPGRKSATDTPGTPGRKKGSGRGRKKTGQNSDPASGDPEKPARSRGRPSLAAQVASPQMMPSPTQSNTPPTLPPNLPPQQSSPTEDPPMPVLIPEKIDIPPSTSSEPVRDPTKPSGPSPYCDFCLGDSRENKKTGVMEELVSCSDCGRSGHPTCLLFTDNMKISVKSYSWQCIECKCCSMCGNSDNDDKLLFCDDCDRGYHMYCLSPPLVDPPKGSWSCRLCIDQFHK